MSEQSYLADNLAIRALLDRYCDGVNQRDAKQWGSTWAKDAVWEIPHLNIKNEGHDNIVDIWVDAMKSYPFVHMMAQPGFIEITGDSAVMRSYTMETAVLPDGTELHPCGQYDDECVREKGEWKFSKRSFTNLHGE